MTRKILVLLLGVFLTLGATACDDDTGSVSDGDTSEDVSDATPDALVGEDVTVSGTVQEVVAGRAFTLTDATVEEGTATTDGDLAVIATEEDVDVSPSDQVVVTGTLHDVDIADEVQEFEDLFGVSLDDDAIAQFEGREVLIATSVETSG